MLIVRGDVKLEVFTTKLLGEIVTAGLLELSVTVVFELGRCASLAVNVFDEPSVIVMLRLETMSACSSVSVTLTENDCCEMPVPEKLSDRLLSAASSSASDWIVRYCGEFQFDGVNEKLERLSVSRPESGLLTDNETLLLGW